MNSHKHSIESLLSNQKFRDWVLHPTPQLNVFWKQTLRDQPQLEDTLHQARLILETIENQPVVTPTSFQIQTIWARIRHQTLSPIETLWRNWQWAAAAVLLIIVCWTVTTKPATTYTDLVSKTETILEEVNNTTQTKQTMVLPDGSRVILWPGSRFSYASKFIKGNNREVYLEGEAQFEVVKNPHKPFLVYANELVAKVLGTSFVVKAYASQKNVEVVVRSGSVSVFAQKDSKLRQKATSRELEGVVLTPNQKIVFARDDIRIEKSLVAEPQIIVAPADRSFRFDETPVSEVFTILEKAYAIDIVFDQETMANCPLTAVLTNQPLFEKITIICKAIEGHYEVLDGQIVIYSKGCKN